MDAHEVAYEIAHHWMDIPSGLSPEEEHRFRFLMQVCDLLGYDHNPINVAHVANIMQELGHVIPAGDEYPKALYMVDAMGHRMEVRYQSGHEKNGLPVVFHNAQEEADYHNALERHDDDA